MAEHSPEEMNPVIKAMETWAFGHPAKDLPFMVVQGKAFTPVSFYDAVKERSDLAEPFLDYLFQEAQEQDEPPGTLIDRETGKQR